MLHGGLRGAGTDGAGAAAQAFPQRPSKPQAPSEFEASFDAAKSAMIVGRARPFADEFCSLPDRSTKPRGLGEHDCRDRRSLINCIH
jgi:hypothetical protein